MGLTPSREKTVGLIGGGLFFGFFAVLAVLVASAALFLANGQAVLRDSASVDHSRELMQAVAQTSADIATVESSARGFVVSGDPEFEQEFSKGKARLLRSLKTFEGLTADPDIQKQLYRLEALSVQRMSDLSSGMLRHKQGLPPRASNDPQRIAILNKREAIVQILNGIRDHEQRLMSMRRLQSDRSVTWAVLGFWSSSLIGLVALTGFFVIIVRYFDSMKKLSLSEQSRALELEERVHERTTELFQANKDLEAFSYSVSHDLRAPLRAMHGYASILKKDSGDHLTSDDMRMLDRIQRNCTKMSELTESLLALFRVGKSHLHIEPVNLSALAAEAVQDMRLEFPDVSYKITIKPNLKSMGDREMLRALLVNLIGNAMKFSSTVERPVIDMRMSEENGERVFVIRDNGSGFDPSQSRLLFEPFQRLHTENEFSGNGIGLAMCQKIVTRHKGTIWLESELGKGTSVFFTLGLGAEAPTTAQARALMSSGS